MEYTVKQAGTGEFQAILKNPSFGWETIYTFTTEQGAQDFINNKRAESKEALAGILTISEYFGKVSA